MSDSEDSGESSSIISIDMDWDSMENSSRVPVLQRIIEEINACIKNEPKEDQKIHLVMFCSDAVHRLVSTRSHVSDRIWFCRINDLFDKMVQLTALWVDHTCVTIQCLELLLKILDNDEFFDLLGKEHNKQEDFAEEDWVWAEMDNHYRPQKSLYFVKFLNTFGKFNGYRRLAVLLDSVNPNFLLVRLTLSLLVVGRIFFIHQQLESLTETFYPKIIHHVINFDEDELKKTTKNDFESILQDLETLMNSYGKKDVPAVLEKLLLDFSLKCFRANNLEKKLYGLTLIEEIVKKIRSRDVNSDWDNFPNDVGMISIMHTPITFNSNMTQQRFVKPARWIEKKYFLDWLINNKIIEDLFNLEHAKEQLLKKSRSIMQFIARENCISDAHMMLIWKTAGDRFLNHVTYEILAAMAHVLDHRPASILWQKITETPSGEFSMDLLNFAWNFYQKRAHYRINESDNILKITWELSQGGKEVSPDVAEDALQKLTRLIETMNSQEKFDFVENFIEEYVNGKNVVQSVYLLTKILDSFSSRYSNHTMITQFSDDDDDDDDNFGDDEDSTGFQNFDSENFMKNDIENANLNNSNSNNTTTNTSNNYNNNDNNNNNVVTNISNLNNLTEINLNSNNTTINTNNNNTNNNNTITTTNTNNNNNNNNITNINNTNEMTSSTESLRNSGSNVGDQQKKLAQKKRRKAVRRFYTTGDVLEDLEKRRHLVDLAINELCTFKRKIAPELADIISKNRNLQLCDIFFEGIYNYETSLEKRLNFLYYIVKRLTTTNPLGIDGINKIWQHFYLGLDGIIILPMERVHCLEFLHKLIQPSLRRNISPITNTVMNHVYQDLLVHCPSEEMTLKWFQCARAYFCAVNMRTICVIGDSRDGSDFKVTASGFFGHNYLWQAIMNCRDDNVLNEGIDFMIKLYTKWIERHRKDFLKTVLQFVGWCFEEIQASISHEEKIQRRSTKNLRKRESDSDMEASESSGEAEDGDSDSDEQQDKQRHRSVQLSSNTVRIVNHCLLLLQRFLERTKVEPRLEPNDDMAFSDSEEDDQVPHATSEIELTSVHQLMEFAGISEIAALLALRQNHGILERALDEMFDDNKRTEVLSRAAKYENIKKEPRVRQEYISPANYLANDMPSFSQLMDLLDRPEIDRTTVWHIIDFIPPNNNWLNQLQNLSHSWLSLLDASSIFRLVYSLQLIHNRIMKPSPESPVNLIENWCKKFTERGGISCLIRLLKNHGISFSSAQNSKTRQESQLMKSCVNFIILILCYFVRGILHHYIENFEEVLPIKGREIRLDAETANNLKKLMNFSEILGILLEITGIRIRPTFSRSRANADRNDISIIRHSMYLITLIMISDPSLIPIFYGFTFTYNYTQMQGKKTSQEKVSMKDFVIRVFSSCKSNDIRQSFHDTLSALCKAVKTLPVNTSQSQQQQPQQQPIPCDFFLELLIQNFPFPSSYTDDESDGFFHKQYFALLQQLVETSVLSSTSTINIKGFINDIVSSLSHLQGDISENPRDKDETLIGVLDILRAYIKAISLQSKTLSLDKNSDNNNSNNSNNNSNNNDSNNYDFSVKDLLTQLFNMCVVLPGENKLGQTKCLTRESRQATFDLMTLLTLPSISSDSKNSTNFSHVLSLLSPCCVPLTPQQREARKKKSSAIILSQLSRREKFVGLNNLGNTCYANSIIQQMYMIPSLRYEMIKIPWQNVEQQIQQDSQGEGTTPKKEKFSAVPEIQKMFCQLQESHRQSYDPLSFLKSLSSNLDIGQQQDADEFYNVLADRLERELTQTTVINTFNTMFKGELHREIVCSVNSNHKSFGVEIINSLSVDTYKKSDLYDALIGFFQGEKIQGFKCNDCDKPVEVTKSFTLQKLPEILVINLKRFRWNMTTMEREKLYHRFEYPMELNLEQFMKKDAPKQQSQQQSQQIQQSQQEQLEHSIDDGHNNEGENISDDFFYDLVGVVVHEGTADMGHYYSIIKDRTSDNTWYKFDDKTITEFNPDLFDDETFGGELDWHQWRSSDDQWKKRNVYMLFYERSLNRNIWTSQEKQLNLENSIPAEIKRAIDLDNMVLLNERMQVDPLFFGFLQNFVGGLEFDEVDEPVSSFDIAFEAIKLGTVHLFETLSQFIRSPSNTGGNNNNNNSNTGGIGEEVKEDQYKTWIQILVRHYERHIPACKWLLTSLMSTCSTWLHFHLIECNERFVRSGFARLIEVCLKVLSKKELNLFGDFIKEWEKNPRVYSSLSQFGNFSKSAEISPKKTETLSVEQPIALKFIEYLVNMMEDTRPHWRRFQQYFSLLNFSVNLSHHHRAFLNSIGIISGLCDFILGRKSFEWRDTRRIDQRVQIGVQEKNIHPELSELLEALAAVVQACWPIKFSTENPTESEFPPEFNYYYVLKHDTESQTISETNLKNRPNNPYSECPALSCRDKDRIWLYHDTFLLEILDRSYNINANIQICTHLAYENPKGSEHVLHWLFKLLDTCHVEYIGCFTQVFEAVLQIVDSLSLWRVGIALNYTGGGLFHQIHNFHFHGNAFGKNKVMAVLECVAKLARRSPIVAGFLRFTANEFATVAEPIFIHAIQGLEHQIRLFATLENLDEREQLSQTEYILTEFKSIFSENSDVKFLEYPKNFKLQDFPISHFKELSRIHTPFAVYKLHTQYTSITGYKPTPTVILPTNDEISPSSPPQIPSSDLQSTEIPGVPLSEELIADIIRLSDSGGNSSGASGTSGDASAGPLGVSPRDSSGTPGISGDPTGGSSGSAYS